MKPINLLCYFCKKQLIDKKEHNVGGRLTCPNCSDKTYLPPTIKAPYAIVVYSRPEQHYVYLIKLHELIFAYYTDPSILCSVTWLTQVEPHTTQSIEFPHFNIFELSPQDLYNKLKLYLTFS